MGLQNQVISFELAKKLKELGVKQDGYAHYCRLNEDDPEYYLRTYVGVPEIHDCYRALTVSELGELLPKGLAGNKEWRGTALHIGMDRRGRWFCGYSVIDDSALPAYNDWFICETDENEAESRGLVLLYLLENKLLQPTL